MAENIIGQVGYNTLVEWASNVTAQAKANILRKNKVATGNLYESITFDVLPDGTVDFYYDDAGDFVESGRRKGARFPPPAPILKWIKIKGIKGRDTKTGRFIKDKALVFLFQRAISRDGIKAVPFMQLAIDKATQQLMVELEQSIAAYYDREIAKA